MLGKQITAGQLTNREVHNNACTSHGVYYEIHLGITTRFIDHNQTASMSRLETRTPGVRITPYFFGKGHAVLQDRFPNSNAKTQHFSQVQAMLLRNILRPACLIVLMSG